jgi:hypothetical protein
MSYLEHREKKNIERIKNEIFLKNSNNPYYVNQTIYSVRNEYDQFPYPHWYKGKADSEKPIISDREAGWIPKRHKEPIKKEKEEPLEMCFQSACSTIYPCYAQDNSYLYLNKACVNLTKQ